MRWVLRSAAERQKIRSLTSRKRRVNVAGLHYGPGQSFAAPPLCCSCVAGTAATAAAAASGT